MDGETRIVNLGGRDPASRDPGPVVAAEAAEVRRLVLQHPRGQLLLRLLDGWTPEELAEENGASVRTVHRWLEEVKQYVRERCH